MKILCVLIVFLTSTSAVRFPCEFKTAPWMAIGPNYQCQTKPFGIDESQYVTSATGSHVNNKTNKDVLAIHISDCTDLSYIPKGFLKIFPNLIGIYLDGCGISSLIGTELNEYPHLKVFALEKSPLNYVPGNFFAETPELLLISFTENKINGTGRNLLSNLNKLSEVYFDNNTCIDKNATETKEITVLIETLNRDCSIASEVRKSISLVLLLSCLAYLGKYNWTN